jgi:hypothetical protein
LSTRLENLTARLTLLGFIGLMTANNKPLKDRRILVSETLETLGPKIQNAQNVTMRVSGDALEEAVLFYAKSSPNVQVLRAESSLRRGPYGFSGIPSRVVRFCRRGEMADKSL